MTAQHVATAVLYHRQRLRISQAELGRRAALSRAAVQDVEHARRRPYLHTLDRLETALRLPPGYLLTRRDAPAAAPLDLATITPADTDRLGQALTDPRVTQADRDILADLLAHMLDNRPATRTQRTAA